MAKEMLFSNRDLKKLFIPLIFEQLLGITVGMADTIMVSGVGEAAVSGVSLVDMLNALVFNVMAALSTGGTVAAAHLLGAGKKKEACDSARQLIAAAMLVTFSLTIILLLFEKTMLSLFFGEIEQDVRQNALIYMTITAFSYPFLGLYNSTAALFRTMGNAAITLKVSVLVNILNVAGNAVCVLGLGMGTAGVAVPTMISRAVGGIILFVLLHDSALPLHLRGGSYRLDGKMMADILRIGIPSGVENGFFHLGKLLVVSMISGFGTVQIAANGIANNLDSLGCIIGTPMVLVMLTVIGRCAGAGDLEQIRYYTRKLMRITYLLTALVNGIILLSLQWILSLYGVSEETVRLTWVLVMIHNGMAIILWPAAFVLTSALRACKDVKFALFTVSFSMWAFRVGLGYVFGVIFEMGAVGIWIAMVTDWIFRAVCFIWRYRSGRWIRFLQDKRD